MIFISALQTNLNAVLFGTPSLVALQPEMIYNAPSDSKVQGF
jgi:hypothetical protein